MKHLALAVAVRPVHAVVESRVKMRVESEVAVGALDDRDGAGLGGGQTGEQRAAARAVVVPIGRHMMLGRLAFRVQRAGNVLAVGTVGGTLQVHPGARLALRILGVTSAHELAEIIGAVGLAQNLAALKALAGEGIQRGHMALHRQAVSGSDPSERPSEGLAGWE